MNAHLDLDLDHILGVCQSLAAPTTPLSDKAAAMAAGAVDREAGGLGDEHGIMLAYPNQGQRDRVHQALSRCGYATETGRLDNARRYGIRVIGWSADGLELRAQRLRRAAFRFGVSVALQQTVEHAIDAAARQPVDADPTTASYDVAAKVTDRVIGGIINETGPLTPLTRFPADPQLGDQVRYIQRLADRVTSTIGDHFNAACVAASTYIRTRSEQTNTTTETRAEDADRQAKMAARRQARSEGHAFIADPVDPDAFVEAAEWAHERYPDNAGAFALDYARDCRGIDRDRWPPLPVSYLNWCEQSPSAPQVAAADFPHPPDTAAATEPHQAPKPTFPRQGRARGPQ